MSPLESNKHEGEEMFWGGRGNEGGVRYRGVEASDQE